MNIPPRHGLPPHHSAIASCCAGLSRLYTRASIMTGFFRYSGTQLISLLVRSFSTHTQLQPPTGTWTSFCRLEQGRASLVPCGGSLPASGPIEVATGNGGRDRYDPRGRMGEGQ